MKGSKKILSVILAFCLILGAATVGVFSAFANAETPIVQLADLTMDGTPVNVDADVAAKFNDLVPGIGVQRFRAVKPAGELGGENKDQQWWFAAYFESDQEGLFLEADDETSQGFSFYVYFPEGVYTKNLHIEIGLDNGEHYGIRKTIRCELGTVVPVNIKWSDLKMLVNKDFTGDPLDREAAIYMTDFIKIQHYSLPIIQADEMIMDMTISDLYEYGTLETPEIDTGADGPSQGKILPLTDLDFVAKHETTVTSEMRDAFENVVDGDTIMADLHSVPVGYTGEVNPMFQNKWKADQAPLKTVKKSSAGISFYVYFPIESYSSDLRVVVISTAENEDKILFGKAFTNLEKGRLVEISLKWSDLKQQTGSNEWNGRALDRLDMVYATKFQIVQAFNVTQNPTEFVSGFAMGDIYEYGYLPGCSVEPITQAPTDPTTQGGSQGTTVANPKLGDVNADGKIGAPDALMALKHSVQSITLTDAAFVCANVNGDTAVNSNDALLIMKYSVHLITKFPAAAQ